MLTNSDISKIRSLNIEDVAEACDMTVKRHKSLCPFHSDTRPSLTFNVRKNTYHCFVCDAKGGTIDLVMHMMNLSFRDACHWLARTFNIILDDKNSRQFNNIKPRKVAPAKKFSNSQILDEPDIRHLAALMCQPYLNDEAKHFLYDERKIKPEVVKQLGLSSISSPVPMSGDLNGSWFNAPSLLIPYKDIDGNLISVQARYLGSKSCLEDTTAKRSVTGGNALGRDSKRNNCLEGSTSKPRFQFPRGSRCSIFNLPILKTTPKSDPIFVTEGVSDCLAIMSAGFKAIAIPSATLLKPQDAELLKGRNIHIYPDRDAPGERLFLDLVALCNTVTRHQLPEGFKDVGQYYAYLRKDVKIL